VLCVADRVDRCTCRQTDSPHLHVRSYYLWRQLYKSCKGERARLHPENTVLPVQLWDCFISSACLCLSKCTRIIMTCRSCKFTYAVCCILTDWPLFVLLRKSTICVKWNTKQKYRNGYFEGLVKVTNVVSYNDEILY
jgi:hypothetical protein